MLRDGQVRYVGRTTQADDCCPENPTMSSVHFSVRWTGYKCELKDLNSANGTWRHGKKIAESILDPGEDFKAGKSTFRLLVDGFENPNTETIEERLPDPKTDTSASGTSITNLAIAPAPLALTASGLAVARAAALPPEAQISDEGKAILVEDMPVGQFIELLASREQFLDALRVVAHSLTKRSAVEWSCKCVRLAAAGDLPPIDEAAVAAAEAWAAEPSEDLRRNAEAAANAAKHKSAGSWTAMAAFWSSGSLGPPAAPVVPPPGHLTGHAAAGAAMLAAVDKYPEKATEHYQAFLQIGREMMAALPPG